MKQEEYRKTIEKAFPLRKELKQDMSRELFRTQNKKRGKKRYVIRRLRREWQQRQYCVR